MSDLNGKVALVSGAARATSRPFGYRDPAARTRNHRQRVFGRQALAASIPGGEVDD